MDPRHKTSTKAKQAGPSPAELLAKMPRRPMSTEQQAAALEKVSQQATQRVKLGQQLFEAAEAKLKAHQKLLDEINAQQSKLREQVQEDVAKSLQSYDQWMGKIDESFTKAIRELNHRLEGLEAKIDMSKGEMEAMIEKAAALLKQTQGLVSDTFNDDDFDGKARVAQAMQQSIPTDPHIDLHQIEASMIHVDKPQIDEETISFEPGPEVIEVDIVPAQDMGHDSMPPMPYDAPPALDANLPGDEDDVFGEVLRRLRQDGDGHAAA